MKEAIIKNPIFEIVKTSVLETENQLFIAVPFITSYAIKVLNSENIISIADKKCITRFDDSNILSFDIPTLEYLLKKGFQIRFNNDIHLKLYITDNATFVSSSNLTQSGFENKIELTVKVDNSNVSKCVEVFEEIWANSKNNEIDRDLLKENLAKYNVLRQRERNKIAGKIVLTKDELNTSNEAINKIINEILHLDKDYSSTQANAYEANKLRSVMLDKLNLGFDKELFYLPEGNLKRYETLFYDLVYGYEAGLAGTGLREKQFKTVFEDPKFKSVVEFMVPEIVGLRPWNLSDLEELQLFCNGIFDFDIPCYKETLPIRLASYFYPNHFVPIFKLEHLKNICSDFGFIIDSIKNGDRLFQYNQFIFEKFKDLPHDNYIKSSILYLLHYTLELYKRVNAGEAVSEIVIGHNEKWKRNLANDGVEILKKMNEIKDA